MSSLSFLSTLFFFFNDTATTEIYTLSLHDALPISDPARILDGQWAVERVLVPQALEGLGIGTLPHGGAGRGTEGGRIQEADGQRASEEDGEERAKPTRDGPAEIREHGQATPGRSGVQANPSPPG